MAHKRHYSRRNERPPSAGLRASVPLPSPVIRQRKPPTQYGKPFILLEDESCNTYEYASGAWVPYELSIAQCRQQFLVKELPQKLNGKTRYEIRCPLLAAN